jgi:uncharacterized iron-regulated membrane protein
MRPIFVLIHRYAGLAIACFLFISGITGAVISWDHELDEWLNPNLYQAASAGTPRPPLELAAQVEAADPRVRVTFVPLEVEPGHAAVFGVEPRVNPQTGKLYDEAYNQIALDPVSGAVQGKRLWGAVSLTREGLLPFLYKLHYSMHIPDVAGISLGILFMGIVGLVWVVDSLIALWLSFPNRGVWRKSFAFRWKQGNSKLNFDLHSSGGVWVWLLVLMLAVTSVGMNLHTQVMRPVVSWFSTLTPSPFISRTAVLAEQAPEPRVSWQEAIATAKREAARRKIAAPAGGVFYSPEFGIYGVGFFKAGESHGDGGLGNPWLYINAQSGEPAGAALPGTGSAGDIFLQAQFPLHSGRIIGLPGRILISALGLVVAMLCVTGIVIWFRRRAARVRVRREA